MHGLFLGAGLLGILGACSAEKINKEKTRKFSSAVGSAGIISLITGLIIWIRSN